MDEVQRATQSERDRCIAIVESQVSLAGDDALVQALLRRIANLIRSGAEPERYEPFAG